MYFTKEKENMPAALQNYAIVIGTKIICSKRKCVMFFIKTPEIFLEIHVIFSASYCVKGP